MDTNADMGYGFWLSYIVCDSELFPQIQIGGGGRWNNTKKNLITKMGERGC